MKNSFSAVLRNRTTGRFRNEMEKESGRAERMDD